jgi:predicted DNA-binding transcriptional regulator AlpA
MGTVWWFPNLVKLAFLNAAVILGNPVSSHDEHRVPSLAVPKSGQIVCLEAGRAAMNRMNLTELGFQPKISTLAGPRRPGNHRLGGNEVMESVLAMREVEAADALLTAEDVALKLRVSKDWVWDHSSRRLPYLPVIRMSDGALRYRASGIEEFLKERERAATLRRKHR